MTESHLTHLAALLKPSERVIAECLQHPVAAVVDSDELRAVSACTAPRSASQTVSAAGRVNPPANAATRANSVCSWSVSSW